MHKAFLNILFLCVVAVGLHAQQPALNAYIYCEDNAFRWNVVDSVRDGKLRIYTLRLVSQIWQGIPWVHELNILVPDKVSHPDVLLHITGGSIEPNSDVPKYHASNDFMIQAQGRIAYRCESVTAVLRQVPRQPLFGGKYEDEIVSYTFHRFQQDGDTTWPLLFPMVKSVLKAMDAIGQFAKVIGEKHVGTRFVLNGLSKRGWTTWLAAATTDKRIVAIAPMVIDILNMPVNIAYQQYMYNGCSEQINDYVSLGLTELVKRPDGKALVEMVDPFSYKEKLAMPKMLFMGTNDEYWTVDAIKNYIDELPAPIWISYVPNTGHGLGNKQAALNTLEAFFWQTVEGGTYPSFTYGVVAGKKCIQLNVKLDKGQFKEAILWEASSCEKDFRKSDFSSRLLVVNKKRRFSVKVAYPENGYKAFFVMLKYAHPLGGEPYEVCTRMYTASTAQLFDKPFE